MWGVVWEGEGAGVSVLDGVVDFAGIGGVEDGDSAAADFGGGVGGMERGDEGAEGFEAGVGECLGVRRHGDPRR